MYSILTSRKFLSLLILISFGLLSPKLSIAADKLLLVGDATWGGWSLNRTSVMLQDSDNPDVFRYTGYLTADKEFKFLTEPKWDLYEYRNSSRDPYILGEGSLVRLIGNSNDTKFKVRESGNYTVVCDLKKMSISVTKAGYQDAPIYHNILYVVGSATPGNWTLADASPLTQDSADPFLFTGRVWLKPGIFKIATNCYGGYPEQKFYFRDAANSAKISEDDTSDRQWSIESEQWYKLSVNLATGDISIVPDGANGGGFPGAVESWWLEGPTLRIRATSGDMLLTAYNESIIKVLTLPLSGVRVERTSISVSATPKGNSLKVTETPEELIFNTSALTVKVNKADCHLSFYDKTGKLVLAESKALDNSKQIRYAVFKGMNDAAFYGGGYNGKYVNLSYRPWVMNNSQNYGWNSDTKAPNNICIPFIVSSSGYGLLFDDHYRYATITPSPLGTTYTSQSRNPIAYYFIGRGDNSMTSVLDNYTFLTGRQDLPPYWALGYLTSRYGYHSRSEAESVVDGIKNAGLPLDGIVMDLYWQGDREAGMGNLDWYKPNWSNPEEMMSNWSKKGVKTICITEPYFTTNSSNYSELLAKGYFADADVSNMDWLGASRVGLIDSSNPAAMDWYWEKYKLRSKEGIAGWWLDLGEPESHDGDSSHMGGTVEQVHNEFANLWSERVYNGYRTDFPDERPFLMPRSGTAGMQRFSTFPWSGDVERSWSGLQGQIPALLSASMSGIGYMGNDIGGFKADNKTNPQLYLRWIELGVFAPMMRTHATYKPEPYLDCYSTVLPDVKKFINMRYSYLPYTYTLAFENALHGTPLARPVNFHDEPGLTPSSADCTSQYLWGKDILVAPILTADNSRTIEFPQGKWVDLNDLSKVYAGGTAIQYAAPSGTLPHFGRVGSFITRFAQTAYTNTSEIDNSDLAVTYLPLHGDATHVSTSVLYDDDHTSTTTLRDGNYLTTTFSGKDNEAGHLIEISHEGSYTAMPSQRRFTFTIPTFSDPILDVTDNTGSLYQAKSKAEFDASATRSYYQEKSVVYVKDTLPTSGTSFLQLHTNETTGIDELISSDTDNLTLDYSSATGVVDYSVPDQTTSALLTFVDLKGDMHCIRSLEITPGVTHQKKVTGLAKGFYIATLTACTTKGKVETSIKVFVR